MEQDRFGIREDGDTEVCRGWIRVLEVEMYCCGMWGSKEVGMGKAGA